MAQTTSQGFVCEKCQSAFPSRNKMFKHVRDVHTTPVCKKLETPTAVTDLSKSISIPEHCCPLSELPAHFVYVLGGRLRGRTLDAVWRFSSVRQEWEECPAGRMLENRGSHGATTVDGVIFVAGASMRMHACISTCVCMHVPE
jgi:hypothetical protein